MKKETNVNENNIKKIKNIEKEKVTDDKKENKAETLNKSVLNEFIKK